MKKNLLLIATLLLFIYPVVAQENFSGVSGNLVTGDFDNDGFSDDLAAINSLEKDLQLNLWLGRNGEFTKTSAAIEASSDLPSPALLKSKIVSGDFDNDGFIDDLAAIYEIGLNKTSLTVWLNNNGMFAPSRWWYGSDFDANQTFQTLVCADFDNDGFQDDIAAFYNYDAKSTKVFVWKSNGTQFNWPGTWWNGGDFDASRLQGTVVTGDFDHDGFVDDITGLYNYSDGFCKAFVWTSVKNKFNWPYTWWAEEIINIGMAKGNIISGDFDQNGFMDNVAVFYPETETTTSVFVLIRDKKGFTRSNNWWFGGNDATLGADRFVSTDGNNTGKNTQVSALILDSESATLTTWTAENQSFGLPTVAWKGTTLSATDCDKNGGCINSNLANTLNIYPNPTRGPISLQIPECNDALVTVSVCNMLGSEIYTRQYQPGQEVTMDEMELKPGTYLLQITGNNLQARQNFIVQ